jgi:hypothetical protein
MKMGLRHDDADDLLRYRLVYDFHYPILTGYIVDPESYNAGAAND